MGGVDTQFPQHAGDPSAAWPPRQRAAIPDASFFYATLAGLLIPVAGAGLLILRHRARSAARAGGGARWARTHELRSLRVSEPQRGRLTLGRVAGRLVAAEARQSVIVIGPVQT